MKGEYGTGTAERTMLYDNEAVCNPAFGDGRRQVQTGPRTGLTYPMRDLSGIPKLVPRVDPDLTCRYHHLYTTFPQDCFPKNRFS